MSEVPIGCLAQRAEMVRRGLEKMLLIVLRLGMVVTSESRVGEALDAGCHFVRLRQVSRPAERYTIRMTSVEVC
jgi:hypothetical protein